MTENDDVAIVSLGSLDLRSMRARIVVDEGDLVLEVDDGDVQVQFEAGLSGTWEQAILGAQRLSSVAIEYADALKQHIETPPVPSQATAQDSSLTP